jgi:hypothetical protein
MFLGDGLISCHGKYRFVSQQRIRKDRRSKEKEGYNDYDEGKYYDIMVKIMLIIIVWFSF